MFLLIKNEHTHHFWGVHGESPCPGQPHAKRATWKKSLKSAHTWKKRPYMEKAPMGAFFTFLINYLWPQKVVGRSIGRF